MGRSRRPRHGRLLTGLVRMVGLLAVMIAMFPVPSASAGPLFVTRNGGSFDLGGQPFRYGGTNNYYLHYSSNLMVDDIFNDAVTMNLKVVRAWTFLECGGDKPNSAGGCSQGAANWMQRWSNVLNRPEINTGATGLQKLDYMLAKANSLGIKLILPFTGNWRDFGGMDQYVTWYGLQFHDQFYTDARIKQNYKDWITTLVNRTNSITGVQYKNDPAIFSWELANEPRCINAALPTSGTCTADTLVGWATEMSAFIKSLDANHMVSVGDEGFHPGVGGSAGSWPYNVTDGVDHARLTAVPTIDYGTYHLYPQGWGQSPADTWGTGWINDHNSVGTTLNKPEVAEEWGSSDQFTRDATYTAWADAVRTGGGDGFNFWILTGVQDDGQLYPDFDGFRVVTPSSTATVLANAARQMSGGGGDTTPPTSPGTPNATGVTSTSAGLAWAASTDSGGSGLAGYNVYRRQGATDTVLVQSTTNSATLTGLTPATQYQVLVRARDGAGNISGPSATVTFTTLPDTGGGTCRVTYQASNWGGSDGFTANVTIANLGTSAINGWTLAFTFQAGQRVTLPGWSATWMQAAGSATVTATNLSWNANIAPNTSVGTGFNGTFTGANPAPAAFTINGNTCSTT
jgi:mannan endo-1,4-beta-mannosidase